MTRSSRWIRHHRIVAVSLAALLMFQVPASAATITVSGGCSLVNAIDAANSDTATGGCPAGSGPDVIELTADVTLATVNHNSYFADNGLPLVTTDITIEGGDFTIQRSTAAVTPLFRIFAVSRNGTLTLNDVTLRNGSALNTGGAVHSYGDVNLTNSTVTGNTATIGPGGIYCYTGDVTVTNSTVSDNVGRDGGGIYSSFGSATLTNSTVSGNTATRNGAGINAYSTVLTLTNSTVSGNSSSSPSHRGGGIRVFYGTLSMTNSTISGNENAIGGGIYAYGAGHTVTNSIIADSPRGANCSGALIDGGGNFADDSSCGAGFASITPGVDFDATIADNGGPTETHALLAGSVAIDAGGACGLTTDQRGVARDASCDSGAYEFAAALVPGLTPNGGLVLAVLLAMALLATLALRRRLESS